MVSNLVICNPVSSPNYEKYLDPLEHNTKIKHTLHGVHQAIMQQIKSDEQRLALNTIIKNLVAVLEQTIQSTNTYV
jgi:hypothetical protein